MNAAQFAKATSCPQANSFIFTEGYAPGANQRKALKEIKALDGGSLNYGKDARAIMEANNLTIEDWVCLLMDGVTPFHPNKQTYTINASDYSQLMRETYFLLEGGQVVCTRLGRACLFANRGNWQQGELIPAY